MDEESEGGRRDEEEEEEGCVASGCSSFAISLFKSTVKSGG